MVLPRLEWVLGQSSLEKIKGILFGYVDFRIILVSRDFPSRDIVITDFVFLGDGRSQPSYSSDIYRSLKKSFVC